MALVMLLSQSAFAIASIGASMDMMAADSETSMSTCHNMASMDTVADHEQHTSTNDEGKACQSDCCDSNDCTSHCQNCLTITASALIPVMSQLHQTGFTQDIILKSSQIPNGFDPSALYRPPRQTL